jgi:hypothetical protein
VGAPCQTSVKPPERDLDRRRPRRDAVHRARGRSALCRRGPHRSVLR